MVLELAVTAQERQPNRRIQPRPTRAAPQVQAEPDPHLERFGFSLSWRKARGSGPTR